MGGRWFDRPIRRGCYLVRFPNPLVSWGTWQGVTQGGISEKGDVVEGGKRWEEGA